MKHKVEKSEHSNGGGIGGVLTFLCIATVLLTVADTVLKLYFPVWHLPFWICAGAIGLLIVFKWFQARRS